MTDKKQLIKSVAAGAMCGILTSVVLMCLLALILTKVGLLDEKPLSYVLTALLGLGALAGGFVAAKINKGAALIAGVLTGAAMMLLLTVTALTNQQANISVLLLLKLVACLLGGAAGGVLSVREKKHRRF